MMSKPRLAEILGVEVNEIFEINGYFSAGKFRVDEKGKLNDIINSEVQQ